ncbi:MAG: YlxR family protein [Acidimicrobiales bacterium]
MRTSRPSAQPFRTCIGCRQQACQKDLIRVVAAADGSLVASRTAAGRGAWLCRSSTGCLDLAARRQSFPRALRTSVTPAAVEELRRFLAEVGDQASPVRR